MTFTNDNKLKNEEINKRTFKLALQIIKLADSLIKKDYSSSVIGKQLLRSATSIGANIIEAQSGSSKRDFVNFLHHSLKSANESKFWLGLLKDSKKIEYSLGEELLDETTQLSNIVASGIITAKGKRKI